MNYTIVEYDPTYDAGIQQLEHEIVQGKTIQLKILKKHFLDRAIVFKKYFAFLALQMGTRPIGAGIMAQTQLKVNAETFNAGVLFDVKVHQDFRGQGINRAMFKYARQQFFDVLGLSRNFTTLKNSNAPVLRSAIKTIFKMYLYDFVYLTIPTKTRVAIATKLNDAEQLFKVGLFDKAELDTAYYQDFESGLGCFYTRNMYRLQITRISAGFQLIFRLLKMLLPQRYAFLPQEGDQLAFACLYNHAAANITQLNEVLAHLQQKDIPYLLVCCKKKDCIYEALKHLSINTYAYLLMSNFPLKNEDSVCLDVRCL